MMKTYLMMIALSICTLPLTAHATKKIGPGDKFSFYVTGGNAQRAFADVDHLQVSGIAALKITSKMPFRMVATNKLPKGCTEKVKFMPVDVPTPRWSPLKKGEKYTGMIEGLTGMNGGDLSFRVSAYSQQFNPAAGKKVRVTVEGMKYDHP